MSSERVASVQGDCDDAFARVKKEFQAFLDSDEELGASITVNIDGRNVLDLWGGHCDESRNVPWKKDTITNVWSTTKAVTNFAALMLMDRGQLDPFAKVATYWPEFAANGKQDIEVRHLLSHTSGLAGWEAPFTTEDMFNLRTSTDMLAVQKPWWEPGTASGYHAHTQGHLVGELFVAEEIAGPLAADFQIGAKESDWIRIADIVPPPPLDFDFTALPADSVMAKTFSAPPANAAAANTPGWRKAELGALNGHSNARGVARMLSAVSLGGEVDGVRLLSQKTIDLIFKEQSNGVDLVIGTPVRFGIGYALPLQETAPFLPADAQRICFWGGWGGSLIIMDLERRMTIAYMMNKMGTGTMGSSRGDAYVRAIYASLAAL
ncbi:hypothetical protein AJ80_08495 [Polytolypa hystricis UAMH7299]|uniref:Beta-lactamase-related domain-containing protein n=1 Tax=Polytolypa hystricis (strain UAMH7299) TaxID=1447883 RepID=A0A2B7X709_POLH7|nr:hypothetical protein AJ80_08495 [Polytolypa hystricis UAMH7299]